MESVSGAATLTKDFANLNKYTKYEFQVLAIGSHGEGPKSSVTVGQTLEDGKQLKLNSVGCKKHFFQKNTAFLMRLEYTAHHTVHLAGLSELSYHNY